MGKQNLAIGTAIAAVVTGASLISSAAAAQQKTPEQTSEAADYVPGQDSAADGQVAVGVFDREVAAMDAARSANDCDAWEMHASIAAKAIGYSNYDGRELAGPVRVQLANQLAAKRAQGCQTLNEQQKGEGLDVVSVVAVASSPSVDLDFEAAQIKDLADRCRNNDGSQIEFLNSQKDRYGRHYREVEAAMNEYRELALTTDDPALAQSYTDNARKYEFALKAMPKPWEFPCEPAADSALQAENTGMDLQAAGPKPDRAVPDTVSGLQVPNFRVLRAVAEFGGLDVPATGIGFQRGGLPGTVPETFAAQTPGNVDYLGLAAEVRFDRFALDAFYREGDASAASSIATGSGVDAGLVYGELSPGGSSGIATPFGLDSEVEVEAQSYGIGASYDFYSAEENHRTDTFKADSIRNRMLLQKAGVTAGFQHSERNYSGTASGSGTQGGFTFDFGQTRDQKISEDQFHLGVEAEFGMSFSDRVAFRSRIGAGGYYRDTSLQSMEVNQNNFTGLPDGSFTVTFDRDDDGFGFQSSGDLFIDFNLSPGPAPGPVLSIGGGIEYQSSTGRIFNPNSGDRVFFDGLTTDLMTDDKVRWFAGIGITLPL